MGYLEARKDERTQSDGAVDMQLDLVLERHVLGAIEERQDDRQQSEHLCGTHKERDRSIE